MAGTVLTVLLLAWLVLFEVKMWLATVVSLTLVGGAHVKRNVWAVCTVMSTTDVLRSEDFLLEVVGERSVGADARRRLRRVPQGVPKRRAAVCNASARAGRGTRRAVERMMEARASAEAWFVDQRLTAVYEEEEIYAGKLLQMRDGGAHAFVCVFGCDGAIARV